MDVGDFLVHFGDFVVDFKGATLKMDVGTDHPISCALPMGCFNDPVDCKQMGGAFIPSGNLTYL